MALSAEPRSRASCRPAESERGTDLPTCRCSPSFCEQPPGSRSRGCGARIELSLARRRLLRRRSVLVVASTPGRAKWDGRASRPSEGFRGGALSAIPCSQPCTSMLVNHALEGRGCFTLHSRPEGFVWSQGLRTVEAAALGWSVCGDRVHRLRIPGRVAQQQERGRSSQATGPANGVRIWAMGLVLLDCGVGAFDRMRLKPSWRSSHLPCHPVTRTRWDDMTCSWTQPPRHPCHYRNVYVISVNELSD